jgi:hypothetical protein
MVSPIACPSYLLSSFRFLNHTVIALLFLVVFRIFFCLLCAYTETERGKESILPQVPKKSFLDAAPNRLARTIAQIRTRHWLCAPYLKRTRKNRDDEVSDRCWRCGQWWMSCTHIFLRCMHPNLESVREEIWDRDRPDEEGRIPKRPTSIGQLLGKAKWEKPLADWIVATGVGLLGPGKQDYEEERIERNDGWRREPFV